MYIFSFVIRKSIFFKSPNKEEQSDSPIHMSFFSNSNPTQIGQWGGLILCRKDGCQSTVWSEGATCWWMTAGANQKKQQKASISSNDENITCMGKKKKKTKTQNNLFFFFQILCHLESLWKLKQKSTNSKLRSNILPVPFHKYSIYINIYLEHTTETTDALQKPQISSPSPYIGVFVVQTPQKKEIFSNVCGYLSSLQCTQTMLCL